MVRFLALVQLLGLIILFSCPRCLHGATPEEIAAAIKRGTQYLKGTVTDGFVSQQDTTKDFTPGEVALAGLALLESGLTPEDETLKYITSKVRQDSYTQYRTYNIACCLLFLDRLGEAKDTPLIQLLGARLAVGQRPNGGWSYSCISEPPAAVVEDLKKRLRADSDVSKPADGGTAKLHPEVERHALTLRRAPPEPDEDDPNAQGAILPEDNSNTQFALLGLWAARRHGLNVEQNLLAVERRFLATQLPNGAWGYHGGPDARYPEPKPSMTCAGLLAIATGLARRDELTAQPAPNTQPAPKGKGAFPGNKGLPPNLQLAARRGLMALATTLEGLRGQGINQNHFPWGTADVYYLWSVERVCMIYQLEKLAGVDWYAVGSDTLVKAQQQDGSWRFKSFPVAGTSLALLFLNKTNLLRDLRAVKGEEYNELRTRDFPTQGKKVPSPQPAPKDLNPKSSSSLPPSLPEVPDDPALRLATELVRSSEAEWSVRLNQLRDEKGTTFTRALVIAANRLDGVRKASVRDALAERLTRMTAATLREMLNSEEPELRRAAALACGMKDDPSHIPDLILLVRDDNTAVWPAARAALKSLTGQDFGPAPNSSADQRQQAAKAWQAWYERTK